MNPTKKMGPPRFIKFIFFAAAALLVLGGLVMLLWNAILPQLLQVSAIGYWQAVGLLLLCKILFGSFRPGGKPARGFGPPAHIREKFMNMNAEERSQFKRQWRERCHQRGERFEPPQQDQE